MIEAGINEGDTVIIKRSDTADNGKIVVALIDDKVEIGTLVQGVPVIGKLTCINELVAKNYVHFVIAFGVLDKRKNRYELYTYFLLFVKCWWR